MNLAVSFLVSFNFTDGATDHIWDDFDLYGNSISDVTLIDTLLVLSSFFPKVDAFPEFSCKYRSGTVNSKFHLIRSFFEILARILSFHV